MKARNLIESDYEDLVEYWKWNRFPPPPKEVLPNNAKGGMMVVDEFGNNICGGFFYETNSVLGWIEFIVASPLIKDRKVRKEGQVFLIKSLCEKARKKGYLAIFASIKVESLIQRYIEAGFSKDDLKSTELIIRL
jgi:hypothetical protein